MRTNISLACGGRHLNVGQDAADIPISSDGGFRQHYHYRNPQSGETVDTSFVGRFSGDIVTGRASARYSHCRSAAFRFTAHRTSLRQPPTG